MKEKETFCIVVLTSVKTSVWSRAERIAKGMNSHPIIIASATRPANIKRLIFPENKHTTISAARTREITVFKRGCFKLFMSASNKE